MPHPLTPIVLRRTRTAAVTIFQRFGSALQLNPHAHSVLPDGVFAARWENPADQAPRFIRLRPPTDEEVAAILGRIVRKVMGLVESLGLHDRPLSDEDRALARTIALPLPKPQMDEPPTTTHRAAFIRGFSLHANRRGPPRCCRLGRPPTSNRRPWRSTTST